MRVLEGWSSSFGDSLVQKARFKFGENLVEILVL